MKMRPGTQTGFLLCGKEWEEGEALEVRSPWDNGLVGRVTLATRADARQAVNHAVAAIRRTRALPRWKRKEILEDTTAALIEQKDRFVQLIVAEAGKPLRLARAEVERAILTFKTAAEEVTRLGGETIPLDLTEGNEGRWGLVQRFPVGPVLAITPFNFPLNLVAHKVAPAMAAGCPIILKPAPQTPFTALALGEIVLKAGWPQEAIAVLPLSNADTAWMVEKEDRIKLVSFTGSSRVGWEIKAHSSRKRMVLELGSNSALIVHGDWTDLDDAALRTAHAAFGYAGQSCISVQRVFVDRSVFQTYLWKVVECATKLVVGNPADEATDVGPLIRAGRGRTRGELDQGGDCRRRQTGFRRRAPGLHCASDDFDRNQAGNEDPRRRGIWSGGDDRAVRGLRRGAGGGESLALRFAGGIADEGCGPDFDRVPGARGGQRDRGRHAELAAGSDAVRRRKGLGDGPRGRPLRD